MPSCKMFVLLSNVKACVCVCVFMVQTLLRLFNAAKFYTAMRAEECKKRNNLTAYAVKIFTKRPLSMLKIKHTFAHALVHVCSAFGEMHLK